MPPVHKRPGLPGAILGLAGVVLVLGLAALLWPLWEMNRDIDEQVELTAQLVDDLAAQLEATEELLGLHADLTEASLPLAREVHTETLPRLHTFSDEGLPLLARGVEIGEESLELQRELIELTRQMLAEVREMNQRMAALEPAATGAEIVD